MIVSVTCYHCDICRLFAYINYYYTGITINYILFIICALIVYACFENHNNYFVRIMQTLRYYD